MFVERVRALLKEKGIPAKVMLQDLEINKNQLTRWEKDGAIPNKALLIAIANYLDTTVEYLTGESDEKKKPPVETEGEYDEDEDFKAFSKVLGDLTPEELQKVLSYAEFVLKQRNP